MILERNFLSFDLEKFVYVSKFPKIWKMALYWFCGWKKGGGLKREGVLYAGFWYYWPRLTTCFLELSVQQTKLVIFCCNLDSQLVQLKTVIAGSWKLFESADFQVSDIRKLQMINFPFSPICLNWGQCFPQRSLHNDAGFVHVSHVLLHHILVPIHVRKSLLHSQQVILRNKKAGLWTQMHRQERNQLWRIHPDHEQESSGEGGRWCWCWWSLLSDCFWSLLFAKSGSHSAWSLPTCACFVTPDHNQVSQGAGGDHCRPNHNWPLVTLCPSPRSSDHCCLNSKQIPRTTQA